ncbi:MAG: helix-turn-helix domain-containing protein, partial [Oscillospiraceae bacterium]|nr:helix-turn-helix domain-containing protein [Oscillospiraceae bacterium]
PLGTIKFYHERKVNNVATSVQPGTLEWLKSARLEAGYASRGTAATAVHYSPETIGRHERGEVPVSPADVIRYSQAYGSPDILFRYCSQCPVGQFSGQKVKDRPLAESAMRLEVMVEDAQKIADILSRIAFDGIIDSTEQADFDKSIAFLRNLKITVDDMLLIGAKAKKNGPRTTGNRSHAIGY